MTQLRALSLLLAAACVAPAATPTPDPLPVATPQLAPASYEREYVADLSALQRTELRARTRGVVEAIHVDEGQAVSAGQLLFVVSARELDHELEKSRAARKSAEAELEAARVERTNTAMLHEGNVVSAAELALAEARLQAARAKVEEARAMEGQAELAVHHSRVRAPFSGVVNRIPHKVGATVLEGDVLTTVTNTDEVFAYFRVSEREFLEHWSSPGEAAAREVSVRLADGRLHPHKGRIDAVETEVDADTGSLGLRARFPNPDRLLRHGGSGKVVVTVPLGEALLIPQKSTFEVQDHVYVYALDGESTARARRIVPKARVGSFYVIDSGIGAAEKFVVEGVQHVREGDRVTPRPVALSLNLAR